MTPVHRAPRGGVGMMLEERMVSAFKEAQAVRIVDPTAWCCDVELWVPPVIAELDRF